jgi:hypothetical protein
MSDPRQWQGALEKVRHDLQKIHTEIEKYAGKPDKPPQVKQLINTFVRALDGPIEVVLKLNRFHPSAQHVIAGWTKFKNAWKNGNGNWTRCKEITPALVGYMNAFELQ